MPFFKATEEKSLFCDWNKTVDLLDDAQKEWWSTKVAFFFIML